LHVSDISWTRKVPHPSEVLEKGQEIEVKILSIDPQNEKISVGLKQIERDPWESIVASAPVGSHVEVEIAKLVSFGAFARLDNGIEGMIHVSEISSERVQKPEEVLTVGEKVMAKVIGIDAVERKIALSIREYQRDLDVAAQAEYNKGNQDQSVSIGDLLGDVVPRSMLQAGRSLADAANELMAAVSGKLISKPASPEPVPDVVEPPAAEEGCEGVKGAKGAEEEAPVAAEGDGVDVVDKVDGASCLPVAEDHAGPEPSEIAPEEPAIPADDDPLGSFEEPMALTEEPAAAVAHECEEKTGDTVSDSVPEA